MLTDEKNEVAYIVAKKALWNSKPPFGESLKKWVCDAAKDYGVPAGKLAQLVEEILADITKEQQGQLREIHTPKERKYGFPI